MPVDRPAFAIPSAAAPERWSRQRAILGTATTLLAFFAMLGLIYALRMVGLLLILSLLFAYTLAPLVSLCETPFRWRGKVRGLSRGEAIGLTYLVLVGILACGFWLAVPRIGRQLGALDRALPTAFSGPQQWGQLALDRYHSYRLPPSLRGALDQTLNEGFDALEQGLRAVLYEAASLLRFLPWLILIPVIAIFLLKDGTGFRKSLLGLLPVGRVRWRGAEFFEEVNQTIAFFVRAQLFACFFIGVVCTAGFLILRVPYAWLLGGLACLFELVPLVGPVCTAAAAVLVAGSRSPQLAIYTVLFLAALRGVHDNLVYPRLIASGIKLHPLAVILALICGAQLAGAIGLFLAIPLTAFISVSYRHLSRQWQGGGFIAEMLKAREPEPVSSPPVRFMPTPIETLQAQQGALKGLRVLLVDDDEDGQTLLAGLLESRGAVVSCAGTGKEALTLLKSEKFDVLLSDIGMPDEDGFALIRRVRALSPAEGGRTPAAALTGYKMSEDVLRSRAAGFHRHLGKPVDADELFKTVEALARIPHDRGERISS